MAGEALAVAIAVVGAPLLLLAAHRASLTWVHLCARRRSAPHRVESPGEPLVTVQLPLYNEPQVAERLIDAACALDWPAARLEIQVLDDSTDETVARVAARVAAWRARGVAVTQVRRPSRDGYKAGALAHGLQSARGELVLVLDADFLPAPDLLRRTVPHFADARVAVVQARWAHLNRDAGWLTEAQALLLDGHFEIEQQARHAAGRFFNFNGTAGLWRRAAIDDAGGWSADTLTEDLDLSYRAQLRGWRFVYLADTEVPAELPPTMSAFLGQQHRWAKGSAQCARKLLPRLWRARLPLRVRVEALAHLCGNFAYPLTLSLALLLAALAVPAVPSAASRELLAATAPLSALAALAYAAYHLVAQRRARGLAAALAHLPLAAACGLGIAWNQSRAVLAGLRGPSGEFVRTPKAGSIGRARPAAARRPRRLRLPELLLALAFTAALVAAVAAGRWLELPLFVLAAAGCAAVALARD